MIRDWCHWLVLLLTVIFLTGCLNLLYSQPDIQERFDRAEHHFHYKEFDDALSIYHSLQDSVCNNDSFIEPCIKSHILRANIYRNRGDEQLFSDHVAKTNQLIAQYGLQDHPLHILLHIQQSVFERENARPEHAKNFLTQALETAERISSSLDPITSARLEMEIGLTNDTDGNYEEAISNYRSALSLIDEKEQSTEVTNIKAQVHSNIGISFRRLGNLDMAISHYQINRDLIEEVYGEMHLEMAYAYNGIGIVYYSKGDYATAGDYFKQAASIFGTNFGQFSSRRAAALNNAGISYFSVNNTAEALRIFEEAQIIKQNTLGEEHPETAVGYTNLARIYMQDGDHQKALSNSLRSIQIRKSIYGDQHPDVISPVIQHGDLLVQMQNFTEGRTYYDEALQITRATFGENHPHAWDIHIKKGHSYFKEDKFYMASARYLHAIRQVAGAPDYSPDSELDLSHVSHPWLLLEALKNSGSAELSISRKFNNEQHLYRADSFFEKAMETADLLQYTYRSEASKLNLIDKNYDIYSNAIEVSKLLYHKTNDSRWLDKMFSISETSRSRIALELLQESEAKVFADVPASVIEQETHYNRKIGEFYQKISVIEEEKDENYIFLSDQYRDSLFYYNNQMHEFTTLLEEEYPVYHELKYKKNLVERKHAQQLMDDDQTIVKYIFSKDSLIAFILQKDDVRIESLPLPADLPEQISQFRQYVLDSDKEQYISKGYALYQKLVQPIAPHIKTEAVIFIPDLALHYLPFEMLVTDDASELPFHQLPYLLKKYRISYAPSVTVMDFMNRSRPSSPRNLLAYAPFHTIDIPVNEEPVSAGRDPGLLMPLPLSRYETQEISTIFVQKRRFTDYIFPKTSSVFLDEEASKSNLIQKDLENYSFLHFATHAFVNESNPALSGIALRGDSASSDMLYVNDIYNLNLNADLVVLGACDTGLGNFYRGEGIIGFTRAFIYAGTSNLVVSMWPVNDQATALLMIDFYNHFRNGNTYAEALQQAKLELITKPDFSAPKDWAAFILFGS